MKQQLHFYGIRVLLESNCKELMDWILRDYRFFVSDEESTDIQVHIELRQGTPPWDEIPSTAKPSFKVGMHSVFQRGKKRYIRHDDQALSTYDFDEDRGTVISETVDSLYQVAYLLILSRVGYHLDQRGIHRMHALSVSVNDQALIFMARSGCGKTTLGLELMGESNVSWLSDEIPLCDPSGSILPFPLPPRITRGSTPRFPGGSACFYDVPRSKQPPKVMPDIAAFLPRVAKSTRPGALFLCHRGENGEPSIRRISGARAFLKLIRNCVVGEEFPQTKAFFFEFRPRYALFMLPVFFSRIRRFLGLAFGVPAFQFEMSNDLSKNIALLRTRLSKDLGLHLMSPSPDPDSSNNSKGTVCAR